MLEALIGILIFSFGVLGLVGLQAQSIRHMNDAQYRGEAVYLASSLIAGMWSDDPSNLATKYSSDTSGAGYTEFASRVAGLPGAQNNPPVVKVDPGPSTGSSLVTVKVYWQMPGNELHRYETTAVVGLN
jgi:type IV pilus assembly protein PilV